MWRPRTSSSWISTIPAPSDHALKQELIRRAKRQCVLPRDPAVKLEGTVFADGAANSSSVRETLLREKDAMLVNIAKKERQVALMELNNLFEDVEVQKQRPAWQVKMEHYNELLCLIQGELLRVREIERQLPHKQPKTDEEDEQEKEEKKRTPSNMQLDWDANTLELPEGVPRGALSCPPNIYNRIVYLETRMIQRSRNKQHASGFFHPASYRQWKKLLFVRVRHRLYSLFLHRKELQASKERRIEREAQRNQGKEVSSDSESPGRFNLDASSEQESGNEMSPAEKAKFESRKASAEIRESDAAVQRDLDKQPRGRRSHTQQSDPPGTLLEPRFPSSSDNKRSSEWITSRRKIKDQRKKEKKKLQKEGKTDDEIAEHMKRKYAKITPEEEPVEDAEEETADDRVLLQEAVKREQAFSKVAKSKPAPKWKSREQAQADKKAQEAGEARCREFLAEVDGDTPYPPAMDMVARFSGQSAPASSGAVAAEPDAEESDILSTSLIADAAELEQVRKMNPAFIKHNDEMNAVQEISQKLQNNATAAELEQSSNADEPDVRTLATTQQGAQVDITADGFVHWHGGYGCTKKHKPLWYDPIEKAIWHKVLEKQELGVENISYEEVLEAMKQYEPEASHVKQLIKVLNLPLSGNMLVETYGSTLDSPTHGKWFSVPVASEKALQELDDLASYPNVREVEGFHGCCVLNLQTILQHGLRPGPSATEVSGKPQVGVYCEGDQRKSCAAAYMTHVNFPFQSVGGPWLLYGALLEVRGDSQPDRFKLVSRSQWCFQKQTPVVTAVHFHVINVLKCFDKSSTTDKEQKFQNWWVHESCTGKCLQDLSDS